MYEIFKVYKNLVDNLRGKNIKVLRTANGIEYFNNNLQRLCEENGIQMQHSVPYTPQQNGVVERKNKALNEMAICMLEDKYFSPNIWVESINYDAFVQNRFPHK